jgi:hypothetical protein
MPSFGVDVFQVQGNRCPGGVRRDFFQRVRTVAFGFPLCAGFFPGAPRDQRHLVGNHESGIEPDAKLSDEIDRVGFFGRL